MPADSVNFFYVRGKTPMIYSRYPIVKILYSKKILHSVRNAGYGKDGGFFRKCR